MNRSACIAQNKSCFKINPKLGVAANLYLNVPLYKPSVNKMYTFKTVSAAIVLYCGILYLTKFALPKQCHVSDKG